MPDSILIPAQGPYAKISLPLHPRLTVIFGPLAPPSAPAQPARKRKEG